MALKWRHISKFLQQIEIGYQYDYFDMTINFVQQLVTALCQIFSYLVYTGNKTSPENSGDPCDVIFGQKRKK